MKRFRAIEICRKRYKESPEWEQDKAEIDRQERQKAAAILNRAVEKKVDELTPQLYKEAEEELRKKQKKFPENDDSAIADGDDECEYIPKL